MNVTARPDIYRAYWQLAVERQRIFERRLAGHAPPWTTDSVLARFRFCNAYRASDRVSQYLIRRVIYTEASACAEDTLLRIVVFRLFSRPDTWQALESALGGVTRASWNQSRAAACLERRIAEGVSIYTNAFILCANKAYGFERKHLNHLALVEAMFSGRSTLSRSVARARTLRDVYEALVAYPLIGPFMAYQIAIDINYSELVDFSEDSFTMAGPGARRGIRKCFRDVPAGTVNDVVHWITDHQEEECKRFGLEPPTLFGRRLHAIDCQNLFCELDKYARVAFPELRTERTRIKSKFTPSPRPLRLFYPPKWGINERLPAASVAASEDTPDRPHPDAAAAALIAACT